MQSTVEHISSELFPTEGPAPADGRCEPDGIADTNDPPTDDVRVQSQFVGEASDDVTEHIRIDLQGVRIDRRHMAP